jgi:asparagine synthase (glutamine-hydrolysing)
MIDFEINILLNSKVEKCSDLFRKRPDFKLSIYTEEMEFIAWGDPIYNENFKSQLSINPTPEFVLKNIYGNYYYVLFNKIGQKLFIGNSLFSILPIYYLINKGKVILSDNPISFNSEIEITFNKRFLLENVLFNYQLFNSSFINGVSLLPANSLIEIIKGDCGIKRHTCIEDFFVDNPISWKKSINNLCDLFIKSSEKYFPDEPHIISLTGGFDGRTLVSTGIYYGKRFSTYGFGTEESDDVHLAQILSKKADLSYSKIVLDSQYIQKDSLQTGLEFIKNASGGASFERAHYLHAAKKMSVNAKYLISGNFGSEIFRAAHITGALISSNLFRLFLINDFKKAIMGIESSPEFDWLNKSVFLDEWSQLKEDIKSLACFNPVYKSLSANQRFYKVIFDEVFRKYYGTEIVNQSSYLINRTPYLDFDFVQSLLKTQLAGVNSDFFTQNPLKRFKGQVLYANIINKTYPAFSYVITDKGYRPIDLMNLSGNLKIVSSFIKKRIARRFQTYKDPFAVIAAFNANKNFWEELEIDQKLFNKKRIARGFKENNYQKDSFFILLSQIWWYNQLIKGNNIKQGIV